MDGLTYCFRDLLQHEVSHRNMPNIINRAKAAAAVVTSVHREEIMESRRNSAQKTINSAVSMQLKPKK
jgi:flagellar biosynthesis component FlhA